MEIYFQPPGDCGERRRQQEEIEVGEKERQWQHHQPIRGGETEALREMVAEIKDTTKKIRMWLGTFESAEEAARAYDEAACLLRESNAQTNFIPHLSIHSPIASRIRKLLQTSHTTPLSPLQSQEEDAVARTTSAKTEINQTSTNDCSSRVSESSPFSADSPIESQLFDDAYRPDISRCKGGSDSYNNSKPDGGWLFDRLSLAQEAIDLRRDVDEGEIANLEFSEFERMKVERQISASLYAINGLQDFMQLSTEDSSEAFWDLPPLCSFFC